MARHKIPSPQSSPWVKTLINNLITIVTILAIATTDPTQANQCPTRCHSCENGVANCKGRSLTAPPKSYPSAIRVIDLQNNHIRILGSRTFRRQQTAEILKMGDNKISALRNDAFRSFPHLMTLDLTGNRIARIYMRAFAGMSHLQTLSLSRNRIRRVSGVFQGLVNMQQLNLANNKIGGIQQNDLSPLIRIRYLDMRDNMISRINPRAFDNLSNLRYLFLNNNPIGSAALNLHLGPTALQLLDVSKCELTAVPSTLPTTISEIRMGNNKIMQINHTDFENVTELQMLTLNNNELHFVADGALTHLMKLKEIWLRGNNLVYVPRDIPPNVIRIYMDSNRIQEIEAGLFSTNAQLEYFSGENNRLQRIDPDTFTGMSKLKTINVQGNLLQTLEPRTFAELASLETLLLSNNPLERIEDEAFLNLPNLTHLSMSYQTPDVIELNGNFLRQMPRLQTLQMMASPGMGQAMVDMVETTSDREFFPMPSVTTVDLSYNNLRWVSPRLPLMFPNVRSMILDGNPFECTERLQWLKDWMSSTDITFHQYEDLTCDTPLSLRGRQIQSLTSHEFQNGGAGGDRSQNLEYRQRSKRRHDTSGYQNIERKSDDSAVQNTEQNVRALTPLALRAQREERRKKMRTRSRSRSRNGKKNRKGKGRRRRNRKGRKNKRKGGKQDKSRSRKNRG